MAGGIPLPPTSKQESGIPLPPSQASGIPLPPPRQPAQAKPYEAPGWNKAFHHGLDAAGSAWNTVTRPFQAITGVTGRANPVDQALTLHHSGTALESVGNALPSTQLPAVFGAIGADLATDRKGTNTADYFKRVSHGDFTGAVDEYYPTSAPELQRLENAHVPVLSAVAHQARNHPIVTGLATTAGQFGMPNIEGHLVRSMEKAAGSAANAVGHQAQRAGNAFVQSKAGQTAPGKAVVQGARAVGKAADTLKEATAKNFGTPAYSLKKALPKNAILQAVGENQGMRYLNAPRVAQHEALKRTKYAFRPEHQTSVTPGLKPQKIGTGSSLEEQKMAVDHYQAREYRLAYNQAPEQIRKAATQMNISWDRYKQNPANHQQILDANMGRVPMDAQKQPIWKAMDVRFAPQDFIKREANVAGIPVSEHNEVYNTARNQFFSKYEPDLSKLDPKAGVRVARMSHSMRRVINETTERLKATDPALLPTQKIGYFPSRNLLEDQAPQEAQGAVNANRRGSAIRTPYDRGSRYGSVAHMREAGMDPFEGLTPEDALRDDLQRKWTNIHATNAFNTLGSLPDRWGGNIKDTQEYIDPKTKQSIHYEEAKLRAKHDIVQDSLKAATAQRGDTLNPKTNMPSHFPSQIPNVEVAKAQALGAHEEMKRQEGMQQRLIDQGTRFVDRSANAAVRQEDAAEKMGGQLDTHLQGIKAAPYETAEGARQALDDGAQNFSDRTDQLSSGKTQKDFSRAFDRVQAGQRRGVGSAINKSQKITQKGTQRITRDVDRFQQIQKNLHAYSIDATQSERKRLETIASKYAVAGNNRFRQAVTKYYVAAYDTKYKQQFLNLAKSLRAELSQDGENAVADRVESQYRVKDPNYINGLRLKEAGINIPGVDADSRIAKDAYDFFVENNVPRQAAGEIGSFMTQLDQAGKMNVVYNPIIHGVFNLGSTYMGRTRDFVGLAKAMPMLLGTMIGHEKAFDAWKASKARTFELMAVENAYQPGGFSELLPYFSDKEAERDPTGRITNYKTAPKGSDSYSAMRRAVTRKSELPRGQQVRQFIDTIAEWNSRVVFDRFEPWYAANLFEHESKRLGSTALAARSVRDAMGTDLITPFEKKHVTPYFWFYPWFKTITRFAIATGIHDPSWWNAPLQGARVEREGEGAGEIRVGNNPYMYVTKSKHGGFDTHTLPLPQRILNSVATLALGHDDPRNKSIDRFGPLMGTVEGHIAPIVSTPLHFAEEVAAHGRTPDYNNPVDPNASPLGMAAGAGAHLLGSYLSAPGQVEELGKDIVTDPLGTPGYVANHALGIQSGYRLPGDNIGGGVKGSPANLINSLRARMDEHSPNGRYPDASQYAQSKAQLEQLYTQYPQARR